MQTNSRTHTQTLPTHPSLAARRLLGRLFARKAQQLLHLRRFLDGRTGTCTGTSTASTARASASASSGTTRAARGRPGRPRLGVERALKQVVERDRTP